MENHRRITEEDLLVTEALIAESYGRLKKSVIQAPAKALGPISQTIREHPLEAAATAVGGGIAAYGIARMMKNRNSAEESKKWHGKKKKAKRRHDPMRDILSAIIPLAMPYITCYLEKYLGTPHEGARDKRPQQE
jgi:hypothetical protein